MTWDFLFFYDSTSSSYQVTCQTHGLKYIQIRSSSHFLGISKPLKLLFPKRWPIHGVHHYNMVSDPGHHSYKEVLASLLWCWETGQGMHMPWQHLLPGKVLTPYDVPMDEELSSFAARRKLERVASYRQLQGYSQQLSAVTRFCKPPVTLSTFKLATGFNIRPVGPNEGRCTVRGTDTDVSYIVDRTTGQRTPVLPDVGVAPLLVLQLDQGVLGCAGVAYLSFWMHMMVYGKFDKIHRMIRDLVGAENGCCRKIFRKTKLWSAYLYSLNKRQFGSGANTTLKHRIMHLFSITEDIFSPVFLKFLVQIGKAWNMPCDTEAEKKEIFNKVLEMPSFTKHLSHPKLSNWFAWNASAWEQMPEFHASKMVYESQLEKQSDPDARVPTMCLWV